MKSINLELLKVKAEAKMLIDEDATESFLLITPECVKAYASCAELLTFIAATVSSIVKENDSLNVDDILSILKSALAK